MTATIQEIPLETQIYKLKKSAEKTERHIKRLIQRKAQESDKHSYLEAEILKHEGIFNWKMTKIVLIQRRQEIQNKRDETRRLNLEKEMQAHIKNLEKIRPEKRLAQEEFDKVFKPVTSKEELKEVAFLKKQKRVGSKVLKNRRKTFSKT